MKDLDILGQMIRETAKVNLIVEYGRASVTLQEAQSPDSSVTIAGIPLDAIIAKRKTRIERTTARHDQPEKLMKIDWPNRLQFNHLTGA